MTSSHIARPPVPKALVALALATFSIGTTEFAISGLLPDVASDLHVSISTAGLLVSGYALGIVAGAPGLTIALRRVPPRRVLLALMITFIVGSVISGLAPNYAMLMTGRLLSAVSHGGFFAIGAYLATRLVTADRQASAVSIMFIGLTVANVIGVPLGTFVGQLYGWRSAFWLIAAAATAALVGLLTLVPDQPAAPPRSLRQTVQPFTTARVWVSVAVTALGLGGMFAAFTYIVPLLTDVAGWSASSVTWILVLFGIGVTAGNIAGGRFADKKLDATILVSLTMLAIVLFALAAASGSPVLTLVVLVLVGVFGFAPNSPMQNRLIRQAPCEPTIGSAANIAAVNVGAALGSWLGGFVIDAGYGYPAVDVAAGALSGASVLVFIALSISGRRRAAKGLVDLPCPGESTPEARTTPGTEGVAVTALEHR